MHLEKPPADDVASFRALLTLAARKKRLLQVGYMWRYNPAINAALEAARQGWLGKIYEVRCTINKSLSAARRPEWAGFRGGTLFELGGHLIDPMIRLMGRPVRVTPFLRKDGDFRDNLADNTLAVFEFPRALGTVFSATMQPNSGHYRAFEVLGTNGTAVVNPIEPPSLRIDLDKAAGPYKSGIQQVKLPPYHRYVEDFKELAAAVRSGKPLSITPREELIVQEALIHACDM